MTDFLTLCLIISLSIIAVHVSCWQGGWLFGVRQELGKLLYRYQLQPLAKPLYDCLKCMSSIWGLFFWAVYGCQYNPVLVMMCCCGMLAIAERVVYEMPEP